MIRFSLGIFKTTSCGKEETGSDIFEYFPSLFLDISNLLCNKDKEGREDGKGEGWWEGGGEGKNKFSVSTKYQKQNIVRI